jgi:hypothetical protein
MSPRLYYAIKYNQFPPSKNEKISEEDRKEFNKYKRLWEELQKKIDNHDQSAFSLLSSIMGMWGYNRRYCGMCGKPIIGKPQHISNRMVCNTCHDGYMIAEQLLVREEMAKEDSANSEQKDNQTITKESNKQ